MDYDIKKLYTDKLDTYLSFSSFFRYPQGLEAFFESYECLRPGLRILDAGEVGATMNAYCCDTESHTCETARGDQV